MRASCAGVVKKCGMLKIVHDRAALQGKHAAEPAMAARVIMFQTAVEHNAELEPLIKKVLVGGARGRGGRGGWQSGGWV